MKFSHFFFLDFILGKNWVVLWTEIIHDMNGLSSEINVSIVKTVRDFTNDRYQPRRKFYTLKPSYKCNIGFGMKYE